MPCDTRARRVRVEQPAKVATAFEQMEAAIAKGQLTVTTDALGRPKIKGTIPDLEWLRNTGMTDLCICASLGTRQTSAWKSLEKISPALKQVVAQHEAAHAKGEKH